MLAFSDRPVIGVPVPQRLPAARGAILLAAVAAAALGWSGAGQTPEGGSSGAASTLMAARTSPEPPGMPLGLQMAAQATLGDALAQYRIERRGGTLAASGAGLKSRFGTGGARVTVPGGDVGLRLAGVGYGSALADVPRDVSARATGALVEYRRGPVVEWYRNGPFGLEQGFTLARRPAGGTGPLTLALAVDGSLTPRASANGFDFVSRSGASRLHYGGLHVTDATGRKLEGSMALADGQLRVRVADRGARYPIVVDPIMQLGPKLTPDDSNDGVFGYSVDLSADGTTALIAAPLSGMVWVFTRSGDVWTQQGVLIGNCTSSCGGPNGTGMVGDARFGSDVALSADGNTALIGAFADNNAAGAAWVFTREGGTWSQQGPKLIGTCTVDCSGPNGTGGPSFSAFGTSVALSDDGDTALITGFAAAASWVFTRTGGGWSQQGPMLSAPPGLGGTLGLLDGFGVGAALSGDGNTALVGAPTGSGAAVVYQRTGGVWTRQEILSGSCVPGGAQICGGPLGTGGDVSPSFGSSVALSRDGNTALIGGSSDGTTAAGGITGQHGSAWVFTRTAGAWEQQGAKLIPNCASDCGGPRGTGAQMEPTGTAFGTSVSLSADGSTALIGAPGDDTRWGAAWLFTRAGGGWSQASTKLIGNCRSDIGVCSGPNGTGEKSFDLGIPGVPPSGGVFGASVAVADDGHSALIGANLDNDGMGAAWSFAITTKRLTVALGDGGGGLVTGLGIECPDQCTKEFPHGSEVRLIASPDDGLVFLGWSGACSGTNRCRLTLNADTAVTASFGPPPPVAVPPVTPPGPPASPAPGPAKVAARCVLTGPGSKVAVSKPKAAVGRLSLRVVCDQDATVALTGKATRSVGKKPKRGKQKTKAFTLKPVRGTVRAMSAKKLVIKLPSGAVTALKRKSRTSVVLTLTASNANGSRSVRKKVARLVAAR